MSVQRKPDMQHLPPDIDRILLGGRMHLHDKTTGLYLFGDLYIAEEFLQELQKRQ